MPVQAKPEGYHTATPYMIVDGASVAIEFYKQAFGAVELMRLPMPDGKVGHAEIKIGDSIVMLADEFPNHGANSPKTLGGTAMSLMLYVDDCDATFHRAVAAGAKMLRPLADQFYGDRSGSVTDPFGHIWMLSTHKEDVPPEEMKRRMDEAVKSQGKCDASGSVT